MKTLLCAIARLENRYLREWVRYHRNIGFTNICLYDNNRDGEETFDEVIADYINAGFVIVKNYRNKVNAQLEAYTDCYATYKDEYDWIAFFDCDEFLRIHNSIKIHDILSKEIYDGFDAVCPCWRNFDDNGLIGVENGDYSVARFSHAIDKHKSVIKSIVRGGKSNVTFLNEGGNPHAPWGCGLKACNTEGVEIPYTESIYYDTTHPSYEYMALNHYRYKTIEEFTQKVLRGYPDGNNVPMNLLDFFEYNKNTPEKIQKYQELLKPITNKLSSAVCCIAKNENKFIREWVKHYHDLQFDKIFLYDNNDVNGETFGDKIQDYIDSGFVEVIDFRGEKVCQLKAYQDCYNKHKDEFDWIAFFDCDEYFHLGGGDTMKTYMLSNFLHNYDLIHVNWVLYGDNDKLETPENQLQSTLSRCLPSDLKTIYDFPQNYHIKSIVRGKGCRSEVHWTTTPHTPTAFTSRCCQPCGHKVDANSSFAQSSVENGYLAHYQFKTVNDFVQKLEKGYPDQIIDKLDPWVQNQIREFFQHNKKTPAKCKIINNWINSYNNTHNTQITKIEMEQPLVSIIVPCYNMGKYVAYAIASVKEQTYPNIECIIVNDGSTDDSENVILDTIRGDKRFKYVYQSNAGVCVARNTAAKLATGKYLLPLDPDDILMNYYVQSAVSIMENDPTISVVTPDAVWYGTNGARILSLKYTSYEEELKRNSILNSSLMKREDFEAIGGYNVKATKSEDWDLWIRLLYKNKKVCHLKDIGYLYQNTGSGRSADEKDNPVATLQEIIANNRAIYHEFH